MLPVTITGDVSQTNNTTTPLGASESFIGLRERNYFNDILCSCFSDTDGTLYFDFSNDGETWRTFPSNGFKVTANLHEFHTAVKAPRWVRVRFVNGASVQSQLEIYTYYGLFRQPNAPLNQPLGLDSDAIYTRNTFPWMDMARGLITGMDVVHKFGRNSAVGTSYTPVVEGGSYQTPTTAQSIEFVSSVAGDALSGAGMHELTIIGLDANWEEQTVVTAAHATDGTIAVAVSGTWLRIYRAYVSKSGTYATQSAGSHLGSITVRVASAGATFLIIPLDNSFAIGQSLVGAYTVPSGHTAHIFLNSVAVQSGKTVSVGFFQRDNADDITSSYNGTMRVQALLTGLSSGTPFNMNGQNTPFGPIVGPADVGFLAYVDTGTANVAVEFDIFLIQE